MGVGRDLQFGTALSLDHAQPFNAEYFFARCPTQEFPTYNEAVSVSECLDLMSRPLKSQ